MNKELMEQIAKMPRYMRFVLLNSTYGLSGTRPHYNTMKECTNGKEQDKG